MSPNWRTGAPAGNRNALKHGRYTAKQRALEAQVRLVVRRARLHIALAEAFLAQEKAARKISKTIHRAYQRPPSVSPSLRSGEPPSPTRGEGEGRTL